MATGLPSCGPGPQRGWSRHGTEFTSKFPDVVAAATRFLPDGVVLDGELLVLVEGISDFGAVQRRYQAPRTRIRALAAELPAIYMAFDLLANGGVDLRGMALRTRLRRLESLAATWPQPGTLQLCPTTDDIEIAEAWFEAGPTAMGIEGVIAKGGSSRYRRDRGRHAWYQIQPSKSGRPGTPSRRSWARSLDHCSGRRSWWSAGTGARTSR